MGAVQKLVEAARRLKPNELRKELDRIEEAAWQVELEAVSEQLKAEGITDRDIDRRGMELRRRSSRVRTIDGFQRTGKRVGRAGPECG
jgi:hypothetical protein